MPYTLDGNGFFTAVNGIKVIKLPLPDWMIAKATDYFAIHGFEFHVQGGPGRDLTGTEISRGYPIVDWNVDDLGVIRQYLPRQDASWHGMSVSHYAYGVEHTGDGSSPLKPIQLDHSAALMAALVEYEADKGNIIPLKKVAQVNVSNYQTVRGFWDHLDVVPGSSLNPTSHVDHLVGRSWADQLKKIASFLTPAKPAPPFGGVLLTIGVESADVITWKRRMAAKGLFKLTSDDDGPHFGNVIEAATKVFQGRKALTEDGVVGPKTWAAAWA